MLCSCLCLGLSATVPDCLPPFYPQTVSLQELQQDFESAPSTDPNNNRAPAADGTISYITFNPNASAVVPCEMPTSAQSPRETGDTLISVPPFVTFHTLILDMSGVSFVDLMGIKALAKVRPCGAGGGLCPHSCPLPSRPSFELAEVPDTRDSLPRFKQCGPTLQGKSRTMRCWSKLPELQPIHQGYPEFFMESSLPRTHLGSSE